VSSTIGSSMGSVTDEPNWEPIISTSSVPVGNSILRVLLWGVVSISEYVGSSPSAKTIKSSSSPCYT
jgi:hypothetical protein